MLTVPLKPNQSINQPDRLHTSNTIEHRVQYTA